MSLLHRRDERLGGMLLSELRHVLNQRLAYNQRPMPHGLDMGVLYRALSVLIEDCGRAGFAEEASALMAEARREHESLQRVRRELDGGA